MLHFNYALDNELKVQPGRLPSGIQTQAFEAALGRMSERFRAAVRMLMTPVAGMGGKSPLDGLSPGWRERIQTETGFLAAAPVRLMQRARVVASSNAGDAIGQAGLESNWNRWSEAALGIYGEALSAFQVDVSRAMSNATVNSFPAGFVKLAMIAKMAPPMLPNVKALSGLGRIDPDYLAGFEEKTPLIFGALAGMSLVGLAAWYFSRGTLAGCVGDCGY